MDSTDRTINSGRLQDALFEIIALEGIEKNWKKSFIKKLNTKEI